MLNLWPVLHYIYFKFQKSGLKLGLLWLRCLRHGCRIKPTGCIYGALNHSRPSCEQAGYKVIIVSNCLFIFLLNASIIIGYHHNTGNQTAGGGGVENKVVFNLAGQRLILLGMQVMAALAAVLELWQSLVLAAGAKLLLIRRTLQ